MFGMVSDKLLYQLHDAFDALGCQDIMTPDFEAFRMISLNTIVRISDTKKCGSRINAYRFCRENWNKIKIIFSKKMEQWRSIPFYGLDSNLRFRTDEEIKSAILITNGLTPDGRKIYLFHWDQKFKVRNFTASGNTYRYEDTVMRLPTSEKMNLFDAHKKKLCSMTLDPKWYMMQLQDNVTDYTVVNVNNQYLAIVRKEDEPKLQHSEETDEGYYVAKIIWGPIDRTAEYGLARLILLKPLPEPERLFMIQLATAPFLILHATVATKSFTGFTYLDFSYDQLRKDSK